MLRFAHVLLACHLSLLAWQDHTHKDLLLVLATVLFSSF